MPKVISIVSYQFLPAKFGGQKAIAVFNKYLSRFVELRCITTKNNSASGAEGYEIVSLFSTSPFRYINPLNFFRIKKLISEWAATHVIIEHPYFGWLGLMLKRFCNVKLIIHSHNIEGNRWKELGKWWWRILLWYEKFSHSRADYNFFIQPEDMHYAIREFGLDRNKCMVTTYGIEMEQAPNAEVRKSARERICSRHAIVPTATILLFNGAFDYTPNRNALDYLINKINPFLASQNKFSYTVLICGRNIPAEIMKNNFSNVIVAGLVDNIDEYFHASDIFVNPITSGGGIKTKLVEALANNCNAVSTMNGAIGVDPAICNGKLLIVPNNDAGIFAEKIIEASHIKADVGNEFFEHFFAGNIARKAANFIN